MATQGEAPKERSHSPLSSDAETEPLPFEETRTEGLSDSERMQPAAPTEAPPASTKAAAAEPTLPAPAAATRNDSFSEGSELTEEGESDTGRTPQAAPAPVSEDEDNSSLSDEVSEPEAAAAQESSALDGLASLASSSANMEQGESVPVPPTSSTLSSDEEEADTTVEASATPRKGPQTLRRAVFAAAGKRRAAATGGAPSLLVEPDAESSAPPSAATSRQASPESEGGAEHPASEAGIPENAEAEVREAAETEAHEEEEAAEAADDEEEPAEDVRDEAVEESGEPDEQDSEEKETEAAVTEGAEHDDAEAIQRRQEAMDLLTRIEIGYAMLRDRLYQERLEELEAESEMIHQGTHPELQLLHTIIDARKDRRLALLQNWLKQEEKERERWAKVEDETAWVNWRDDAANVRRDLIDDTMRKRRRLDREKRLLDTPQPTRRHQPFEAELIRKPPAYSRRSQRDADRYDYATQAVPHEDIYAYLAYPDLRGLDEYDALVDLDQMGIRPMPPMYPNYVPQEEVPVQDVYAPYAAPPPAHAAYPPPYPLPPGYVDRPYDAPVPLEYPVEGPLPEYEAPYPVKGYPEPYPEPHPQRYPPPGMPYMPPRGPAPA